MSRLLVIICCMFVVGIAWTSIFDLPEAPPKREIPGKFGARAVVIKVEPKPVSVKVAEPETEAPEIVSYAVKSHWGRVTFTHTNHTEDYGFDCAACHHLQMEGGFNKCSSCHKDLKKTLHNNCFRGCHRKLKVEGKKTGPTTCTGCHVKGEVPEAPPRREIPRKDEVSPAVTNEKQKAAKEEVAEPETEPPETVSYAEKSTLGRVSFTHTKHTEDYGFDCGECHHLQMEGGYNKCSSCHDELKDTFHKNCYRGCHRELKAEGKKTGPTTCTGCHVKGG